MIVIPALDLRDGACVQLVGGRYDCEALRIPDPVTASTRWTELGFRTLHVVDLDAALGRGDNAAAAARVLRETPRLKDVQIGGGIRDVATIDRWIDAGATRVVVGTRALEDRAWLGTAATAHPGRLVVAVDVREGQLVTRGWTRTLPIPIDEAVRWLSSLPLAALFVTAVHREGRLAGTDLRLVERVVRRSSHPVQASGGIASFEDLRLLSGLGAAAAVLGMALYTGALDARQLIEEYAL